jgi:hypothetical protein
MTDLWLLEDLEPFPDTPAVGDDFAPTTFWLDADSEIYESPIPSAICTSVTARVEARQHGDRTEWVAHLGGGFHTALPGERKPGVVELHGCLFWDRYLWLDYRTEPAGSVRLVSRSDCLVQRRRPVATPHPGWFTPHYSGPLLLVNGSAIPDDHDIRLRALRIRLLLASPSIS